MKKIAGILLITALLVIVGCSKTVDLKSGTYEGSAKGYGGDLTVKVTLSSSKMESVQVTSNSETDGIGSKAIEKLPAQMVAAQSVDVDSLSGATVTSKALKEAVTLALASAGAKPSDLKAVAHKSAALESKTITADVVVIGAGGAGMSAALEAKAGGKKVVVLEKTAIVGGNTTRSTGGMNAAETAEQASAGISDSVELFIEDTMKGGKNINDPALVTVLAEQSAPSIEWLHSIGAHLTSVGMFGGASVSRIHRPLNEQGKVIAVGSYLVPILEKNLVVNGVEILFETAATDLITENGVVTGVKAASPTTQYTINAKAVIIATGGFGANEEMYTSYQPQLKGYVTTNVPAAQGDGIRMAQAVGAATVDMKEIQIHPTVEQATGALITEGLRGDGAILVNAEGKRFTDELGTRDVVSAAEVAQTGGYAYLIIDQAMVDASAVIQGYVKNGFTVSGATYAQLGQAMGVDGSALTATMETYKKMVESKKDDQFARSDMKTALTTAPYYAIKIAPGVHHTMGGIKINTNTEVINTEGKVIPGLYAAGEVTGGVHGANRLGGNAVADVVIFGRLAGKQAASYAK